MSDWKKILIAVDQTPTSEKALDYTAGILRDLSGAELCLLYIYPEPPPNFYSSGGNLQDYKKEKLAKAEQLFADSKTSLQEYDVPADRIQTRCEMAEEKETISDTILKVQADGEYGTVVVGKRGVSKAEEFLFGSISNGIVHHCKDFAVWVVG